MRSPRNVAAFYDPTTRIWRGARTSPVFNPNQSLGELVLNRLAQTPTAIAQVSADSGAEVSCGELRLRTIRIAQALTGLGYSRDRADIIAMAVRNGEHVAPALFACFALGIPVNTLDATFKRDDLGHMLGTVRPTLVFCDQETIGEMSAAMEIAGIRASVVVFGKRVEGFMHVEDLLVPTGVEEEFVPVHFEDASTELAIILCSSGTTGRSKGVSLSHSASIVSVTGLNNCYPNDVILCFSSLYWYSGFAFLLLGTIFGAKRIITREPYSPDLALDFINQYRVTITFFSPATTYQLLKHPQLHQSTLASLRVSICGGASISGDLKQLFERTVPHGEMCALYGLSEAAGAVTSSENSTYKQGSSGFVKPNYELKIVDDAGRPLDIDQEGEILVRAGLCTFMGYYGNSEATAEMLDPDGWLHTGDIGRVDEDGLLYIVDRKKDIIKYNGYQISPTELETIIQSVPGVINVCVTGVPVPGNDLPAALVVKRNDEANAEIETVIVETVRARLGDYKQLRGGVYFVAELPMTPSGKILRRGCRDILVAMYNKEKVR
ncbi:hypothetical protein pipiens_010441 [Culex pipiens pipiens]|uniref:Luciferin 4-monooxygenase n=1 Tax=Culex pipiens pipiens TaxID=38569 RepID=A0ABD1DA98_CULPP